MSLRETAFVASVAVWVCAATSLAGVDFTTGPEARAEAGGARITFGVSGTTDVEVAILDAKGRVVRHLAAGVLGGPKPPPEPLKPGLKQALVWDGKDDDGRAAKGGPFSVRVRAAMTARFGRVIGQPGRIGGAIYGLATDEKGNLYVASGAVYASTPVQTIKVFDRTGKYLRTILPMPASLKPADLAEFGEVRRIDGHLTPENFGQLVPYVQPGGVTAFIGNAVRDGVLWLVNTDGRICRLRAADGAPLKWNSAPKSMRPSGGPMCWAVGPGGKSLYMTGWWNARYTNKRYRGKIDPRDGIIYRIDPNTGKAVEFVRIDVPKTSFWLTETNGWYHFKNWSRKNGCAALHGLAVDADGNLLVCDRVNQRLAVYSPEGKLVGSTAIEWPDLVALGPGGKSVYVTTRKVINGYKAINEFRVIRLSAAAGGRVLAETTLRGKNAPSMAVDAAGERPVIWLSNVGPKGDRLVPIVDHGDRLVVGRPLGADLPAAGAVVKAWVDPESDTVFVNDGWNGLSRYDGMTGAGGVLPIKAIDLFIGPDRCLYLYGRKGWNEPVYRCDLNFKPVPFSGTGKPTTGKSSAGREIFGRYGTGWSNKGIFVTRDGRIFVRSMYDWNKYFVTVFAADGTAEKHGRVAGGIVGPLDNYTGGIKIDRAGYFYLGTNSGPKDRPRPDRRSGCVVKVKPTGGGVVAKRDDLDGIAFHGYFFEGAVNVYEHLAPKAYTGCCCKEARFDLDDFGRLYLPDALDFCVRVYDNAGNVITRFGHYSNADTAGPGSLVPTPEIGLGWPMTVSVNRAGRAYIADVLNQRIVRVDLTAAVERTVKIE